MRVRVLIICLSTLLAVIGFPQKNASSVSYTYKIKDTVQLELHIYYPKKLKRNTTVPAPIFFFGGEKHAFFNKKK